MRVVDRTVQHVNPDGTARQVAVTGIGVVSSCGIGKEQFFKGLLDPTNLTAPRRVLEFDASGLFEPKELRRVDRFSQFATMATHEALLQAKIIDGNENQIINIDPNRIGVMIATGVGGLETLEGQIEVQLSKGAKRVSPFLVPMMMSNAASANISMRYKFQGPCETVITACASSTHSIGNAARLVASGRCDIMIAGGAEAPLTTTGIAAFRNMTALSSTDVSMPFDKNRDGFVIAEGAATLILEDLEHAKRRGANILGLIIGAASSADAHHITAPAPNGLGALSCMQLALEDANLEPEEISHINAHGTSTPLNDAAEAEAIGKLFSSNRPPVTSIKGAIGHSLGAAGAIEAVACILTNQKELIPPTIGLKILDPEFNMDVVKDEPRKFQPGNIISNSFGFGGHNGSVIIAPPH